MKKLTKLLQVLLYSDVFYDGAIDGLAGPKTVAAIKAKYPSLDVNWPIKRKIIAALQLYAEENSIPAKPIDGLLGPVSQTAIDELIREVNHVDHPLIRPEELMDVNPNHWPKLYTPAFDDFYGPMGDESNLVSLALPYRHYLSWAPNQSISRLRCHKKVAASMERILGKVLATYGLAEIKRLKLDNWGGCYNVRPIRGGTKPSMHSWGIAMDYYPSRNRLRWGADKAVFARPEYGPWWEIWEQEGWVSLGRSRNFDWMHVQAAKI